MTLKPCTSCKTPQTTKTVIKIGRDSIGLYLNCAKCDSTFIIRKKNWKEILKKEYGD